MENSRKEIAVWISSHHRRSTFDQVEVRSEIPLRRFELEAPGSIGPPGAAYGYLPKKSSHQNLQKVTGFVGGFPWLRVRNQ